MNKVLIVDASSSDCRIMAGLLTKAGYDPVTAEDFDAAKEAVEKLLCKRVNQLAEDRRIHVPGHRHSEQPEWSRPS